jgi:hypothetical protein
MKDRMDQKRTVNNVDSGNIRLRRQRAAFCPACGKIVELMTFATAANTFKTDTQDIELLAGTGSLHRVHNSQGRVMICSISLFDCFDNRRTRLLDSHFAEKASERWKETHSD